MGQSAANPHVFLGRRLDRRRSRAETGGPVFSEFGRDPKSEKSSRWRTAITATPPARCRSATNRRSPSRSIPCVIPCIACTLPIATAARLVCKRESCHIECVNQLEDLLKQRGDQIAAVIVEPLLQGAGGMIVHPVEFLQKIRALCTNYDVLLIADEVLTGFGRTGKMFACDLANIAPDLMCVSKGITGGFMTMGVTFCTDRSRRRLSQRKSSAHVLSRPFLHRERAGLRCGQCQSADFRRRAGV